MHSRHWAALGTNVLANVWAPEGTVLQLGALGDFLLRNMMLAKHFWQLMRARYFFAHQDQFQSFSDR